MNMNCNKAREILDSVFNGEEPALAREAHEHIRGCAACREWQASTIRTLDLLTSSAEPPVPDIASMVMRDLPPVHPAAARTQPNRRPVWYALAGLGACWSALILILVPVLSAALRWLNLDSILRAYNFGRAIAGTLDIVLAPGKAVAHVGGHIAEVLARTALAFGPAVMLVLLINITLLAVVVYVWRRRPGTTSACLI